MASKPKYKTNFKYIITYSLSCLDTPVRQTILILWKNNSPVTDNKLTIKFCSIRTDFIKNENNVLFIYLHVKI